MKKSILIIASACAFIFGSSVLISCDNASTTSTEETTEEHVHTEGEEHAEGTATTEVEAVVETTTEGETAEGTKYACSMKCEGDKTYASADEKCATCGMDLTEVKAKETTTEAEGEPETEKN